MEIKDLLICNNISQIYESNIILYGTGTWGEKVADCLDKMGKTISLVCTTNGMPDLFRGHPIESIQYIRKNHDKEHTLIIIASMDYHKEMVLEYQKLKFEKAYACTVYAFFVSLRMNIDNLQIPLSFHEELKFNLQASNENFILNNKSYIFKMLVKAAEASEDTILILQPGKVGSRSIWNSIKNRSLHLHSIVIPYGCAEFSKRELNYYINRLTSKKLKIICGIREPISRDFSAFFQNSECELWPFSTLSNNVFWWYGDFFNTINALTSCELKKRNMKWIFNFEDTLIRLQKLIVEKKLDEFSWFDYEIKSVFGIDVFKHPFNKDKGYTIIKENNTELLLYKLENLSTLENVIAEFIGNKNYTLDNINENNDKIYSYIYRQLKEIVPIDFHYYEYYYKENRIRHFYTEEEIHSYKQYWKKHIISKC